MKPMRAVSRRALDRRTAGLGACVGPRPGRGWIRAIREALGMSTYELGQRMGISASRVSQLERAEEDGSIRLSALERSATSLNCTVSYALVPSEPLEDMVRRQAYDKAATAVAESAPHMGPLVDEALHAEDPSLAAEEVAERIEELAHELVDRHGLWRADVRPPRRAGGRGGGAP